MMPQVQRSPKQLGREEIEGNNKPLQGWDVVEREGMWGGPMGVPWSNPSQQYNLDSCSLTPSPLLLNRGVNRKGETWVEINMVL